MGAPLLLLCALVAPLQHVHGTIAGGCDYPDGSGCYDGRGGWMKPSLSFQFATYGSCTAEKLQPSCSSQIEVAADADSSCYFKSDAVDADTVAKCINVYPGLNFYVEDEKDLEASVDFGDTEPSCGACAAACAANPECTVWVFCSNEDGCESGGDKVDANTCTLKHIELTADRLRDPSILAGAAMGIPGGVSDSKGYAVVDAAFKKTLDEEPEGWVSGVCNFCPCDGWCDPPAAVSAVETKGKKDGGGGLEMTSELYEPEDGKCMPVDDCPRGTDVNPEKTPLVGLGQHCAYN